MWHYVLWLIERIQLLASRDITFAEGDYYSRQHFHDNKFLSKSSAMEERKLAILAPAIFIERKGKPH